MLFADDSKQIGVLFSPVAAVSMLTLCFQLAENGQTDKYYLEEYYDIVVGDYTKTELPCDQL